MQALLVNPPNESLPDGVVKLVGDIGWHCATAVDCRSALEMARHSHIDALILAEPPRRNPSRSANADFHELLRWIETQRVPTILVTDGANHVEMDHGTLVEAIAPGINLAELRGRLTVIERYHGLFKRLEQELQNMERIGKRLNQHFREVDQEMRLAGRLQRDFLPDLAKPIGKLQFESVYRPANWVSGDMFDVFRIDEHHTGIYIADAVGHGMAASLLTMFIKKAIHPTRNDGNVEAIVDPGRVITSLNEALAEQALPNCQFVTACYALVDQRTMTMQFARGGHPYPMLISASGALGELKASGGLLGLEGSEEFPMSQVRLSSGDKVIFITDGVEVALPASGEKHGHLPPYCSAFETCGKYPIAEMFRLLEARLDDEAGSLNPRDDVTIVGFEVRA